MLGRTAVVALGLVAAASAQYQLKRANPHYPVGEVVAWEPNTGEAYGIVGGSSVVYRFDAGLWTPIYLPAQAPNLGAPAVCTFRNVGILLVGNGQTWVFNGQSFTQLPAAVPPAQVRALGFDEARSVALLIAGPVNSNTPTTWEFDGSTWQQRVPLATPPALQYMHMAYDPSTQGMLMRISNGSGSATGYYTWDGSTWHNWSIGGSGLIGFAMATAPLGAGVMFSGGYTMPYFAGGTGIWSQTQPFPYYSSVGAPPLCPRRVGWFDRTRGITVFTNTGYGNRGTWQWDGVAWSQPEDGVQLPDGIPSYAFDTWRGRVLGFGGTAIYGFQVGELWQLENGHAEMIGTGPPPRIAHACAFDSVRGRFVVFGGAGYDDGGGSFHPLLDAAVWEWDGSAWTSIPTTATSYFDDPRHRRDAVMAFDRASSKVVQFGGSRRIGSSWTAQNDTYTWDGIAWTRILTNTLPTAGGTTLVFHAGLDCLVLQSGAGLWTFTGSDWQPFATMPFGGSIAYDPARDRLLAFTVTGTFELQPGTTAWSLLSVEGPVGAKAFDLSMGAFVGSDWLGHFDYRDPGASRLRPFGVGCAGSSGEVVLHGEDAPRVGTTLPLHLARLPIGAPFVGMLGAEATTWNGQPLPIDLSSFGMPGCFLHTAIDAHELRSGTTWPVAIPNLGALLGLEYRLQAFVFDAAANALGATTSTAVAIRIGG